MATLKALKFDIKTKEGIFETEYHTHLWFGSTKPEYIQENLKGIIDAVKKVVHKNVKEGKRVSVSLYGLDASYKYVDGYRYICEWDYTTEYRKWIGTVQCYDLDRQETYRKKNGDGDASKQAKAMAMQMYSDAIDFMHMHDRVPYDLSV